MVYIKDYQSWNSKKESIEAKSEKEIFFKERDIWYIHL
jgi:hypothetical protein